MKKTNNKIKRLENKNTKIENKIDKLETKYNRVRLTTLSKQRMDDNSKKGKYLLSGVAGTVLMSVSILYFMTCLEVIDISVKSAAFMQAYASIGSISLITVYGSIYFGDNYENRLLNKLKKLDKKICKEERKKNKINNEINKLYKIAGIEKIEEIIDLKDTTVQNKVTPNFVKKNNSYSYNRRLVVDDVYDDDYRDDTSHVVNSLKREEIVFKGIEERPKTKKRTI